MFLSNKNVAKCCRLSRAGKIGHVAFVIELLASDRIGLWECRQLGFPSLALLLFASRDAPSLRFTVAALTLYITLFRMLKGATWKIS